MSYRPVELRAYVEQAKVERRAIRIKDVEWQRGPGESIWLEIHVNPLVDVDNGAARCVDRLPRRHRGAGAARRAGARNRQLESAYEELQAINDTLRERTVELDEVNEFLESILTSIRSGVVVVDLEMRVLAWNRGGHPAAGSRAASC